MKTKTLKKGYLAPEIEVVTLLTEGVLCSSPTGFGMDDMDIIDGEDSGFNWND
ncbi:MAG: hypothetical protein IJX11_02115 [Bacteroidales bacterium]|nr:hypothetical protein [Bacteroidales bacterium]